MNQANQPRWIITLQTLIWSKNLSIWKSDKNTKVQDCILNSFSEGKNYNQTKHCEQHNLIKNNGES